jgi:hypothetical protein
MRIVIAIVLLSLAAACAPSGESEQTTSACDARATNTWNAAGADYSVEAATSGPDCQRAVATIVIRDSSGAPLYAEAHMAEDIMMLAPAHDVAAMRAALRQWVTFDNHTMATTSALPDWPQGASGPQNGEFPFHPEAGYDRDSYMALRANNLPLLCYVQGMESQACLALSGEGELTKIGVQTFPG